MQKLLLATVLLGSLTACSSEESSPDGSTTDSVNSDLSAPQCSGARKRMEESLRQGGYDNMIAIDQVAFDAAINACRDG